MQFLSLGVKGLTYMFLVITPTGAPLQSIAAQAEAVLITTSATTAKTQGVAFGQLRRHRSRHVPGHLDWTVVVVTCLPIIILRTKKEPRTL